MSIWNRLFGKSKPAHSTRAGYPPARPHEEIADGGGVPRSRGDHLTILHHYEDLPPCLGVLTATGHGLEVTSAQQREVAVLALGSNTALLLVTEAFFGTPQHMTLLSRARRAGIAITEQRMAGDPSILTLIYEHENRRLMQSASDEPGAKKAESIELFEHLIAEAVRQRATDLHILIRDGTGSVIFRIDGLLRWYKSYPATMLSEAVGVAYNKLAEESSRDYPAFNPRLEQSCSVVIPEAAGRALNLRFQSIPAVGGFDVILRVLFTDDQDMASPSLEALGYAPSHQRALALASRKTVGAIFIAGVTGSGKSTTLKTLMTMSPDRHLWKQYAIEDPAEYRLPGVTQVSVQRRVDTTSDAPSHNPFAAKMRVILRGDPDEIMVGEVRDTESGSLLKTMVQSGHQVLTTVHSVSAIDIIDRLTSPEIGLPRQTLTSRNFVSAFVYQRLLALNCRHCAVPAEGHYPAHELELIERKFGISRRGIRIASEHGCDHCKGRGVVGLTVAAEIIVPDKALLKLVRAGKDMEAEDLWRSRRVARFDEPDMEGKTAFEHALYKMSQGLLDPRVIEDSFEPFETYELYHPSDFTVE